MGDDMFTLHPSLQKKIFIGHLNLCSVLMEDCADFVWLFLVPQKENVTNMLGLTHDERLQLMTEIEFVENTLNKLFQPDQTNVAMIGNVTPQLHVHVMCRYKTDKFWPGTVWGQTFAPYSDQNKKQNIIELLQKELKCQK